MLFSPFVIYVNSQKKVLKILAAFEKMMTLFVTHFLTFLLPNKATK